MGMSSIGFSKVNVMVPMSFICAKGRREGEKST
jgi:hypothetical protein